MSRGALIGLGQGLAQAGGFLLNEHAAQRRMQWQEEYRQKHQQQAFDHQDALLASEREHAAELRAEERGHQEGLLRQQWQREDERDAARSAQELQQLESQAAYTDHATESGQRYKLFFNKSGQEIGRVGLGDAGVSGGRQYLDPLLESRLKSLDSEISALNRLGVFERDEEQNARLQELIRERDRLQLGGQPGQSSGMPAPGDVVDGYRFKGGNPSDANNWEEVR